MNFCIRIEGNEGRTHCPFCTVIPDTETTRINDFAVIYDTENRIIGNEAVDNHPNDAQEALVSSAPWMA